ncbi:MAG: TorF family putative porin [Gammaproteobacteria bacterium]
MKRNLQSKLAGLGAVALAVAAGPAWAEVSSTVTVASDYDFRGITQTGLSPALQGSLDWEGESGLYAGLWGSNIDFGQDPGDGFDTVDLNVEVDFILGYAGDFTENFGYDVGATYYKYLGNDDDEGSADFDYLELYAGLGITKYASTKVWYSPDFSNSGESAWYLEANGDIPLVWGVGLALHAGYNAGDYWSDEEIGYDEFYDYSVGLTRTFGHFDFAVKYIDGSDLKEADCSKSAILCPGDDKVFSSEAKAFISVSTTFPWAKEE